MRFDDDALSVLRNYAERPFPFVERCGVEVLDLAPGRVRMAMPLEPNVNHVGTMYAGALFTLAELPGGVLSLVSFDMERYVPIVAEVAIRFRRPATTTITVDATLDATDVERIQGDADRDGKALYTLDLELVDAHGEVVARSRNDYQLRARQP